MDSLAETRYFVSPSCVPKSLYEMRRIHLSGDDARRPNKLWEPEGSGDVFPHLNRSFLHQASSIFHVLRYPLDRDFLVSCCRSMFSSVRRL
jgi:hypothetical protein